ncbi:enoyl-CoA hydratase/isomerase family protein [Hymenobacter terrenus]|uniref:enoyl-CoA hydratase/isomerase family protein n=1 Tax=Hymenobacter terrenus TaxID=1629124 RepID=UPI0009E3F8FC|nr:enoyl-CoA hydratase/isomerase family protein [Hymenobacter terrenus]
MNTPFDVYSQQYPNIRMERSPEGVLLVTLHEEGGPFLITERSHPDLSYAFEDIGADRDNKVVILTGAGEAFCTGARFADPAALTTPQGVATLDWEARQLITNYLNIEVPVVAAINGPVTLHSDIPLLADIVLAADTATFQDGGHFTGGLVPGDGIYTVWSAVLGPSRAKYFLLTGQTLSAAEALQVGAVNEVVPRAALLDRAWEHANRLAQLPNLVRRYTRVIVTQRLKSQLQADMGYGLALEGLALESLAAN